MLVAAAVCPQTPLLVPQVAGEAASELATVREASIQAVNLLRRAEPDLVIAIASGGGSGAREARFGGTFRRFGVDLEGGGSGEVLGGGGGVDEGDGEQEPFAGLVIARWLFDAAVPASAVRCEGWEIGAGTGAEECAKVGQALAERSERVGLLVIGDGSARRTEKAPGYLDERAVPFDDGISRALADADTAALAAVDPEVASAVMAAGRAPWQVLAAAAGASGMGWRGELLAYDAPYGVGYFTAFWERAPGIES